MNEITFHFEDGSEIRVLADVGESLLEVARKAKVAIDAPCSGNGSCGKCRVKLLAGNLESQMTRHISADEYAHGWRLACMSRINAPAGILVPAIASAYQSNRKAEKLFDDMKASITAAGIVPKHNFAVLPLRMEPPTLADTLPDNERLIKAIQAVTGSTKVSLSYAVLVKLATVLREQHFQIQAMVSKQATDVFVYDICSMTEEIRLGGVAIDLGTTTVSAVLVDLQKGQILAGESVGNGQIRYGADVINRMIESAKPGGLEKLKKAVLEETINPLIQTLCEQANVPQERIYQLCVAGNTTMNHLLLGINTDSLRMEPYIPTFLKTDALLAANVGIAVNPEAAILLAPNIGSYVGGDITAGTFASMLWNKQEYSLLIDLGTNGELVFGNSDFLISCACSAGPAFEGGDISCGMRATDGAIEACTIDGETMEPTFSVIGITGTKPVGLCGSGIIDVISELFRLEIIDAKGKFIREGSRICYDEDQNGSYVLVFEEAAEAVKRVAITEVDIDNFIRAKGAIFSAIRTMLAYCGFELSMIEHVYIAGGIGSGINIEYAISIGMFPDLPRSRYHYMGNASLTGAYAMLCSVEAAQKVYELSRNMTYLELSTMPQYMEEFVGACFLPHTDTTLVKA